MSNRPPNDDSRAEAPRRLDFLQEREWKINHGYSRFIRFFRKFMVLIALGLIVLVAAWLVFFDPDDRLATPDTHTAQEAPRGETALVKAQYDGVDTDDRPFRVTADQARQSTDNTDLVEMDKPMADMTLAGGQWMAASSDGGLFHQDTSVLTLDRNVKIFYDDGLEFSLDTATIDLKSSSARSDRPVEGQGPAGRITAQGLTITGGGQTIIFDGPASLRLRPLKDEKTQ